MKKIIVLFLIAVNVNFGFAETGERYFDPSGEFSVCPPANWHILEFPGLKYHVYMTEPINGFSPHFLFIAEQFTGDLPQYVEANIQNMKLVYPDIQYLKNESFTTNNGARGTKLAILNPNSGNPIRQFLYIFSRGSIYYVITCSVGNNNGQQFEPIYDESVKTFRFE